MDERAQTRSMDGQASILQNMVKRFPMTCTCFEPVFNRLREITNLVVLYANAGLETILGIDQDTLAGKTVTEIFGTVDSECAEDLLRLINETYRSENKTCEIKARMLGRVYRISFLFVSDDRLLVILDDIHAEYFRRNYQRAIPWDVIAESLAKSQSASAGDGLKNNRRSCGAQGQSEAMNLRGFQTLEIIRGGEDLSEPYDAVFRDSLTGLYDRGFAMEALRMYVDTGVLPLSVVLGDVNGLKTINESLGFQAGDDILVRIARVLVDNCRADDVVTRWNDGEYMLLLPNASQAVTQQIIKRLQAQLNTICGGDYNIVTFGYATSEKKRRTAEELLREAEKWIYQKKLLINQSHRSSIIRLLLSMLHEKSAETQEHSDRLASHCRIIATILHLPDELVDDLILLSMLHDIGKVGIPDVILNKPGALTAKERKIINQHPEIGYRIAQTVPELKQVATYILAHHERWDGTGYPKGLRGEEIPIASRIIAILDAFDVMITGRQYQPARTKEEAIAELRRCSGTQFDPSLTSIYIKWLESETAPEDALAPEC